ncbi:MAG: VWA domain-containing protein, partial [Chloroflexota bacterium]
MVVFRYYRWDGSQEPFRPGADDLMDALSENLYEHGDLQRALRDLFRRGMEGREGQRMSGLQDMQRQLNQQRREKLKQNDLDSVIDDIQEKLEEVVQEERQGIERSVREAQDKLDYALPDEQEQLQGLMDYVQKRADRASETLDNLPESPAGQIQELQDYDFVDSGAREKFDELMNMLRQQMMQNFAQEQSQMLQNITPEQQQAMRDMLRDLNEMMQQRAQGQEPDFQSFMDKWGDFFPDKPESLDELLDMLQQQMAQMQSLLNSMSPEARQQLMQMIQESLDQET